MRGLLLFDGVEQSRIHTSRERGEAHGNGEQHHRLNKIEEQRR
jgi:hypothetical protein